MGALAADSLGKIALKGGDAIVRCPAAAALSSIGPAAVPVLSAALKDPDDGLAVARATLLLQAIEGGEGAALPAAVVRLTAVRKPAGAIKVLLAYLPFAEEDSVVEEVRDTLAALAVTKGEPDADLVAALRDPLPIRRAVAAGQNVGHPHDCEILLMAALALAGCRQTSPQVATAPPSVLDAMAYGRPASYPSAPADSGGAVGSNG